MIRGLFKRTLLLSALAMLAAKPVHAVSTLDFSMLNAIGYISYAGGANPFIGSGIKVSTLTGNNTPTNSGSTFNLIGATLDFTTGNLSGTDSMHYYFSGGGSISLIGGVDVNGDGDANDPGDIPTGTTLLAGSFLGTPTVTIIPSFNGRHKISTALFFDRKDPSLAALFGLSSSTVYLGDLFLDFRATGMPTGGFERGGDVNGRVTNTTPEPTSLLFLGSGLVAASLAARRRRRSNG